MTSHPIAFSRSPRFRALLSVGLACATLVFGLPAAAQTAPPQSLYEYDAQGNLTRYTDPLGHPTEQSWNMLDQRVETRLPHPASTGTQGKIGYTPDGLGQVNAVMDPRNLTTSYTVDGLGNVTQLVSPDTGTASYTYNAAGGLLTRTDARGKVTSYTYDTLDRPTKITWATAGVVSETVTLTYDQGTYGKGHLTSMANYAGTTTWVYDAFGHVLSQTQKTGTLVLVTSYAYDNAGRLTSLTYPSGHVVAYHYDVAGQVSQLDVDGAPLLSAIKYTPFGSVLSWTWGNGSSYARTYDSNGRLSTYPLGSDLRRLTWDAASRVTAWANKANTGVASATYDNLDRIIGYTNAIGYGYAYDANSNRTQLSIGGSAYAYGNDAASNRITTTAGPAPARTYTYDAAGFPSTDSTRQTVWYDNGRLKTMTVGTTTTTYQYNGFGQRLVKNGTSQRRFAYDEAGHLIGEYDSAGLLTQEHIWLGDLPVLVMTASTAEVVVDNTDTAKITTVGTWTAGTAVAGYKGSNYLSHVAVATSTDSVTWKASVPSAGTYNVYARWVAASTNASNATYSITHNAGTASLAQNQQINGGQWVLLGAYALDPAKGHTVTVYAQGNGAVIADAIKFAPADSRARVDYVFADQINTPRLITDNANAPIWRWDTSTEPFGQSLPTNETAGKSLTYNLRFPGQYYDTESGLHYNWNRYYDPQVGRYVSSDPIGIEGGVNTYSYAEDSPLLEFDMDGLLPLGERGQTRSASGTDNPYKKLSPDPEKPGNVIEKDSHTGKRISKPAPEGFEEWWNKKHPKKPFVPRGVGGFISSSLCIRLGVAAILMAIPGNAFQCSDPCKCGDLCLAP